MSEDGFRADKQPTKKTMQAEIMALKAQNSRLTDHVSILGPLMGEMMKTCFDTLKVARHMRKDLDIVVVMDQANSDEVKIGLDQICELVHKHAAQYRSSIDPFWDPATIALPKTEINDLILDVPKVVEDGISPQVRCKECDWEGFNIEVTSEQGCPICGKETEDIPIVE